MISTSTTFRAASLSAVIVVCATGATACGAGSPSAGRSPTPVLTAAQPSPAHVPTRTTVSGLSLPIEPYLLSEAANTQMLRASGVLMRQCMAHYGFSYTPPDFSTSDPSNNAANMSRRYGVVDMSLVGTYGYHKPKAAGAPAAGGPHTSSMSTSERLVFLGNSPGSGFEDKSQVYKGQHLPEGGCSGETQRKLGTGMNQRLAEDIDDASYHRSLANPELLAAFAKWSACMKQSGYSLASPAQAPGFLLKPSPTAAEIQTAKADVTCKKRTNVIGVWFAVESAIQDQLISRNEEALAALRKSEQATLKKAAQVLQGT